MNDMWTWQIVTTPIILWSSYGKLLPKSSNLKICHGINSDNLSSS
jgi:hypothetical protein